MAKDPAFLFYSQDFIVGVQTMNFEDRGKYITVLAQMHQQGRMDEETIRFVIGSISEKLKSKFKIDEQGLWYNLRLEKETRKRNKFTESRRKNGQKGGRPKENKKNKSINNILYDSHYQNHMDSHMGNENENEKEDIIENENDKIGGLGERETTFSLTDIALQVDESNLTDEEKLERQNKLSAELMNSTSWIGDIATASKINHYAASEIAEEFINHIIASGEYCQALKDVKRHAINWIKKRIKIQKGERNSKKSFDDLLNRFKDS